MNERSPLPERVRAFICGNIDAVETLRVLLLLYLRRERLVRLDEVQFELRSSQQAISKRLEHLRGCGLVATDGEHFRYHGAGKIDDTVGQLLRHYRERPTTVIDSIYSTGTS